MHRRAALTLIGAALVACKQRALAAGPARVVSISPSTTEAVFAIGAGALLVGRSRYCDYPEAAKALPVVGGFSDPNVEAILALRPTLVVGAHGPAGPSLEQTLNAHGVATFFPETESLAQISSMIEALGARLGHEGEARACIHHIEAMRAEVASRAVKRPRIRAALLFDVAPPMAAGPGSFPDELLRVAGADNVVKEGGAYPTVPIEHLLALAPAVILDGASDGAASRVLAQKDAPGFRELAAMKGGHVRVVASEAMRPGPRIGEGLDQVERALVAALAGAP
jgi:iron complex transport system substrate-binding protein